MGAEVLGKNEVAVKVGKMKGGGRVKKWWQGKRLEQLYLVNKWGICLDKSFTVLGN